MRQNQVVYATKAASPLATIELILILLMERLTKYTMRRIENEKFI